MGLSRIRVLRIGIGILALAFFVFTVASCAREPSKPSTGSTENEATQTTQSASSERAQFEFVRFTSDPAEPDTNCVVTVVGDAERVTLAVPGASTSRGAHPGFSFWKQNGERIELSNVGPEIWEARFIAPGEPGVYPVSLVVTREGFETTISKTDWVLRVYPPGLLSQPSYQTPELAITSSLAEWYPDTRVGVIEPRPFLPFDKRNKKFNRLYIATFTHTRSTPTHPAGPDNLCFYVVKDGPNGNWRVLSAGSSP